MQSLAMLRLPVHSSTGILKELYSNESVAVKVSAGAARRPIRGLVLWRTNLKQTTAEKGPVARTKRCIMQMAYRTGCLRPLAGALKPSSCPGVEEPVELFNLT